MSFGHTGFGLGTLALPAVLRAMARRESGSTVATRREKALRRAG